MLYNMMYRWARNWRHVDDMLIAVHPSARHFYRNILLFETLGAVQNYRSLEGAASLPMRLDIPGAQRRLQNLYHNRVMDSHGKFDFYRFFCAPSERFDFSSHPEFHAQRSKRSPLDGLFAQNGGAIVTRLALQLMPRPERVEMFLFWIDRDEKLERIVEAIRTLLTGSGLVIGGINLMNANRVSATAGASAVKGSAWIGTGVVYGQRRVVRAGRKVIRRTLVGLAKRVVFINERRLRLLETLSLVPVLASLVSSVRSAYDMLSGRPNEFALSLAYQMNPEAMPQRGLNRARDGCGLLWYAPLVPMTGASAREYVEMVKRVCGKFGFSAPITFSTLSVSGFDSTVPLIFPLNEKSSANATACLKALISEGKKLGFHPYRFHSSLMDEATSGSQLHWSLAERIRAVIDPENLIAPRRYQRSRNSATSECVS